MTEGIRFLLTLLMVAVVGAIWGLDWAIFLTTVAILSELMARK